jgi:adenylate cyclase
MQTAGADPGAARRELDRILSGRGFARNDRLARFLRFVVERHLQGRDGELKESVIAVEVFGRSTDHDPKQDSIVRTEAGRLRARLNEYYCEEGKDDSLIIELPKGAMCRSSGRPGDLPRPKPSRPRP